MERIKQFLQVINDLDGDGYGYGSGSGSSTGTGIGYGSGSGSGSSTGSGFGSGYGSGSGSSTGTGIGYGYGSGSGSGSGSSTGTGIGYGYGSGSGSDYGSGSGSGYGYGSGSGTGSGFVISEFNGIKIHNIDNIKTGIIKILRENIAKGFILNKNLTTSPCYIVKEDNQFAHGATVKEAFLALKEKLFNTYTIEERIQKFKEEFKDFSLKYSGFLLFDWHNKLTGSCKMGRESFCRNNNINLKDTFTIYEFIELTKDQYGGNIIKQLI